MQTFLFLLVNFSLNQFLFVPLPLDCPLWILFVADRRALSMATQMTQATPSQVLESHF